MREPGAVIGRRIARDERAETDLDAFISKRHEQSAWWRESGP